MRISPSLLCTLALGACLPQAALRADSKPAAPAAHVAVDPLVAALKSWEQPRGCWAYTVTSHVTAQGTTATTVERFNPSQPDDKLWTVLSVNGQAQSAATQEAYRKTRLQQWKRTEAMAKKQGLDSQSVTREAKDSKITLAVSSQADETSYSFTRPPGRIPLIARTSGDIRSYTIGGSPAVLRRESNKSLGLISAMTVRIEEFQTEADYAVVDPAFPPFVQRTHLRLHMKALGHDFGEVTIDTVYSDYRKVTRYQDRFEVRVGLPQVIDVIPQ